MGSEADMAEAERATGGMVSPALSTDGLDLTTLPARLDDVMLAQVQAVAEAPLPALPPCDDKHLAQCLRAMQAVLPRQHSDELTGELFVRTYQRQLGSYPNAALSYLAQQATARCKWFPTIHECLDILSGWQRSDGAALDRAGARAAVEREMQARMGDAFAAMKAGRIMQAEIDGLPDRWKRIAVERGQLRRDADGAYVLRRPIAPLMLPAPIHNRDDEKAKAA